MARQVPILRFDDGPTDERHEFLWSRPEEPYLARLRTEYEFERITSAARNDYEKIRAICAWVHGLWQHDGDNEPEHDDPLSILEAVTRGERFRCVEYSTVISGCLNALGIPSRSLGLLTADCETRESEAGHVVVESYPRDIGRWVMVDGQFGAAPVLGGIPLNAVEFQSALAHGHPRLGVEGIADDAVGAYLDWVGQYLCYFTVPLDNHIGVGEHSQDQLMLIPLGWKRPEVVQRHWPITDMTATHSLHAFYAPPGR